MLEQEQLNSEQILFNYWATEDTVHINAVTYNIEYEPTSEGVYFYAVRNKKDYVTVLIPKPLWEQLDCGLKIAYAYNCVLAQIEEVLVTT